MHIGAKSFKKEHAHWQLQRFQNIYFGYLIILIVCYWLMEIFKNPVDWLTFSEINGFRFGDK